MFKVEVNFSEGMPVGFVVQIWDLVVQKESCLFSSPGAEICGLRPPKLSFLIKNGYFGPLEMAQNAQNRVKFLGMPWGSGAEIWWFGAPKLVIFDQGFVSCWVKNDPFGGPKPPNFASRT